MRCIFCKNEFSNSCSVEHIVSESFGNSTQVLPKGIVCDKCNNYFALRVEKPFLEQECIRTLRFETGVQSKKGKIPNIIGKMAGVDVRIDMLKNGEKFDRYIGIPIEQYEQAIKATEILVPAINDEQLLKKNNTTARFLAKLAIESLAWRMLNLIDKEDAIEWLINEKGFDELRKFAREGNKKDWDYNIRRIYSAHVKRLIRYLNCVTYKCKRRRGKRDSPLRR